ncbi:unnamed protein product [Polarella glacialis]|uniref:Uncharacterized protein n=1 Tax=Polarella glacialis TaxID=89957 RepID=A0A813HQR4_POLGL|nr:unnamed protein product [Polarella glacialis]
MVSATLESAAVFQSRATALGLTGAEVAVLQTSGFDTFAGFAFAVNYVPGHADDAEFLRLCAVVCGGAGPAPGGRVSVLRRLFFESYTLAASDMRSRIDGSQSDTPRRLAAPERAVRYREQVRRLPGLTLRGELDVSHQLVDLCIAMHEEDVLRYVELSACAKREQELKGIKLDESLKILGNGTLRVDRGEPALLSNINTDLHMKYALQRRALAFDQARIVTFSVTEACDPPAGYARVSVEQLFRADRELFRFMQETARDGIRMTLAGALPCDAAMTAASSNTSACFLLLPLAAASGAGRPVATAATSGFGAAAAKAPGVPGPVAPAGSGKRALRKQAAQTAKKAKGGGKGKPDGKSKKGASTMPVELAGMASRTAVDKPICWTYNLACGCPHATPGEECRRGLHVCCSPGCKEAHSLQEHAERPDGRGERKRVRFSDDECAVPAACSAPTGPTNTRPVFKEFRRPVLGDVHASLHRLGMQPGSEAVLGAGSAGLTAQLRRVGFVATAFDHSRNRHCARVPVVSLDLTLPRAQDLIFDLVKSGRVVYIHVAPPCGTATKARERPVPAAQQRPLRSALHPGGLPSLAGLDKAKVDSANCLYEFCAELCRRCLLLDIAFSVENPASSYLWELLAFRVLLADSRVHSVIFHQCMHGGERDALRRWMTNMDSLKPLAVRCDGKHKRKPWGARFQDGKLCYATADEAAYPELLCKRVAEAVKAHALAAGAVPGAPLPASLCPVSDDVKLLSKQRAAASGKLPRGRLLPQVIPEFKGTMTVRVEAASVFAKLQTLAATGKRLISSALAAELPTLPVGAKVLELSPFSEEGEAGAHSRPGGIVKLGNLLVQA